MITSPTGSGMRDNCQLAPAGHSLDRKPSHWVQTCWEQAPAAPPATSLARSPRAAPHKGHSSSAIHTGNQTQGPPHLPERITGSPHHLGMNMGDPPLPGMTTGCPHHPERTTGSPHHLGMNIGDPPLPGMTTGCPHHPEMTAGSPHCPLGCSDQMSLRAHLMMALTLRGHSPHFTH